MHQPQVLQIGPLSERFNSALAAYAVTPRWLQADPQALLREQSERFELLVTSARFGCAAAQLARLPNLKAICSFGVGRKVSGKRLGRIGEAVVRRASGFGMPVRYHNRTPLADCPHAYEASLAALRELDNLVLLPPIGSASEETRLQMEQLLLANLQAFVEQGQVLTPV